MQAPKLTQNQLVAAVAWAQGYSNARLAKETGYAPQTITNILKGRYGISPTMLDQLCRVLRIPAGRITALPRVAPRDPSTRKARR